MGRRDGGCCPFVDQDVVMKCFETCNISVFILEASAQASSLKSFVHLSKIHSIE